LRAAVEPGAAFCYRYPSGEGLQPPTSRAQQLCSNNKVFSFLPAPPQHKKQSQHFILLSAWSLGGTTA
jgi:hypothetical protein